MKKARMMHRAALLVSAGLVSHLLAAQVNATREPAAFVYREIQGQKLNAFVFLPHAASEEKAKAAVLLFHGGAWTMGSAQWTFDAARRFADLGLVAVAVDYRLSKGEITPIEAVDDTRAAFRWVRRHAAELHVDPTRVAGYGVSAGGQLVAVAAMLKVPGDEAYAVSSGPDLLLLWSPAVDAPTDLLHGRGNPSDYSPMELAGAATPPTCIINGDKDIVTPLERAEKFRDRVVRAGGICELHVYPGVGHLLTRNIADQLANFDPDPKFREDGLAKLERFLRAKAYISGR